MGSFHKTSVWKINFKWRFLCRIKQRSWWDWAAENFGPISAYLNTLNDDNILGWINHHQMTSYQVLNLLKILGRLFIISKMLLDNGSIDPFWAEDLFNWSDNLLRAYLIPYVVRNSVRTYLARSMVRKWPALKWFLVIIFHSCNIWHKDIVLWTNLFNMILQQGSYLTKYMRYLNVTY